MSLRSGRRSSRRRFARSRHSSYVKIMMNMNNIPNPFSFGIMKPSPHQQERNKNSHLLPPSPLHSFTPSESASVPFHNRLPSRERDTHESDMLSRRSCIQYREYQYRTSGRWSERLMT